jgi:hypothetical protein
MKMSRSLLMMLSTVTIFLFGAVSYAQDSVQRPNEMEFDARVVKGQRVQGAVYLFQRAVRPLPPLLHYKRDYLGAIVSPIFGRDTELGKKIESRAKDSQLQIGDQQQKIQPTIVSPDDKTKTKALKKKRSKRKQRRKKWSRSKRKGKK